MPYPQQKRFVTPAILSVILISSAAIIGLRNIRHNSNETFDVAPSRPAKKRDDTTDCGFDGNADLYGIGIRIGFYLQTASVAVGITTRKSMREIAGLASVNVWFGIALLTATSVVAATSNLYAVEAYIVCLLLIANNVFLNNLSQHFKTDGFRSQVRKNSRWIIGDMPRSFLSSIAHAIYLNGSRAFYFWFWWRGVNTLHLQRSETTTHCQDYVFLLAQVRLESWYIWLMRVALLPYGFWPMVSMLIYCLYILIFATILAAMVVRPTPETVFDTVRCLARTMTEWGITKEIRWDWWRSSVVRVATRTGILKKLYN